MRAMSRWMAWAAVAAALGVQVRAADTPAEGKRELLSRHETIAQFQGVQQRTCMGRTALCPDRCGHSGSFAAFKILTYTDYEKPGNYGDPKQGFFAFQLANNAGKAKTTPEIAAAVAALQAGDCVRLDWRHEYITRDGSSFPERPVVRVEKITREDAEKATGKPVPEFKKPVLPPGTGPVLRSRLAPMSPAK